MSHAMHAADREALLMALSTTDLPREVTDLYAIYQRIWSRVRSGAMSIEMIVVIARESGLVKAPEEVRSRFGNVKPGQAIYWWPSAFDEEIVTFSRLVEPQSEGLAEIITALDPDHPRRVPEARLSLLSRAQLAAAQGQVAEQAADPEDEDDDSEVDATPSAETADGTPPVEAVEAEQPSGTSMVDRWKQEYPTGTPIGVAVPGESPFDAVAKGVGSGQYEGRIKVEDKDSGKQRWVSIDHVMKSASV